MLERDRDSEGKRQQTTISVRKELGLNKPATKAQAESLLVAKLSELQRGIFVEPNDVTMAELIEHWWEHYAETSLADDTQTARRSYISNHINPSIGHIPAIKLRSQHLQRLYTTKLKKGRADSKEGGLSPSTIHDIHKVVRGALALGVEWEIVPRNVADSVKLPKLEESEMKIWTDEEAKKFLAHVREHRLYPLYYLAITTGMRRGEILGLRWQDINWGQRTLSIRQRLNSKAKVKKRTKTKTSKRSISLSPSELAVLRNHRKQQLIDLVSLGVRNEHDLVFLSEAGTPINPRNLLRNFQNESKKAKVPIITIHALRHTCATLMLLRGVHAKIVSERLGHSRVSITLDLYSHVLPNMQMDAALALESLLADNASSTEGGKREGTLQP